MSVRIDLDLYPLPIPVAPLPGLALGHLYSAGVPSIKGRRA